MSGRSGGRFTPVHTGTGGPTSPRWPEMAVPQGAATALRPGGIWPIHFVLTQPMTNSPGTTRPHLRAALAGASALVVVALVLGADLKAAGPVARDHQRDNVVDRGAARHLTATLARAVRDLVGQQGEKPALHAAPGLDLGPVEPLGMVSGVVLEDRSLPQFLLRPTLLDLPPPTCA